MDASTLSKTVSLCAWLLIIAVLAFACSDPPDPTPVSQPTPTAVAQAVPSPTAAGVARALPTSAPTPSQPSPRPSVPTRVPSPEPTPPPSPAPSVAPIPTATPVPTFTPMPQAAPTATPAPTAAPTATESPTQALAPGPGVKDVTAGGTLRLAARQDIAHQDVHQEVSPALSTWGPGIAYSRLMRVSSGPGVRSPSLAVECELCESWTMKGDRTFVFKLRRGVRWQQIPPVDGRELTAEDILFSYRRQGQSGWPNAPLIQGIESMEAVDPYTLRISLTAPDADFLLALADGHTKIVAREAVELNGDLREGPTIGSGPWMLTGTQRGNLHTFERHPGYFEKGLPYADQVVINIIEDAKTRSAAFAVDLLDVIDVDPLDWERLLQRRPRAPFLLTMDTGTGLEVGLKASAPPFDDDHRPPGRFPGDGPVARHQGHLERSGVREPRRAGARTRLAASGNGAARVLREPPVRPRPSVREDRARDDSGRRLRRQIPGPRPAYRPGAESCGIRPDGPGGQSQGLRRAGLAGRRLSDVRGPNGARDLSQRIPAAHPAQPRPGELYGPRRSAAR